MNKGQVYAGIRDFLNRPNLPDSALDQFVANAESDVNRLLDHPRMTQRVTVTIADDDTSIVALPNDILRLDYVRIGNTIVQQYPQGRVADMNGFVARGDCLEFVPSLAADTVVSMDYKAGVPTLVGASSTFENWLSRLFPSVYLYGALKEAAVYLKDDQRLAGWSQRFAQEIAELEAQGWNQNIAAAPRVRLG